MTSVLRIILLAIAFLGLVGLAVWAGFGSRSETAEVGVARYKRLSGTVAEGFVYRVGREKHPRATCDACRVGKLKLGPVSLGAFNTIEFDGLTVNLPEAREAVRQEPTPPAAASGNGANEVLDALDLRPVAAMARTEARKFAGITIAGLRLNRMVGESLQPLVKAAMLKNKGKRIMLYHVVLFRDGRALELNEVELKTAPGFRLEWADGSWDLTEFFRRTR